MTPFLFSLVMALSPETPAAQVNDIIVPDGSPAQQGNPNAKVKSPEELLKKAIEAHGGKENILKPRKGTVSGHGKVTGHVKLKGDLEITFKEVFDLPRQWKETITLRDNVDTMLKIGDEAWEWYARGPVRRPDNVKYIREPHFGYLKSLVDFTGEGHALSPLDKEEVNGETTVGIRVEWQKKSVDCFFSEKTGLLLRCDDMWAPQSGNKVPRKTLFNDHRQFDGVKLPYHQITYLRDKKKGELVGDMVIDSLEITKDLPKDSFVVPKREHAQDGVGSLKQVLEKAIEAHGGKENILKPRKGMLSGHDKAIEGTFKEVFDLPRQWKLTLTFKDNVVTNLKIGDQLWEWDARGPIRKPDDAKYVQECHFGILKALVEFTGKDHILLPLDKETVNGETTAGIRVEWQKMSGDCYFSEKTGLLLRWDNIVVGEAGDRAIRKALFSDHREVDGVKLPYRQVIFIRDKKLGEFVLNDVVIDDLRITNDLPKDSFIPPKENK